MSINRRTAIAVRSIGVASAAAALALGVAGNALACNISEFTAAAACDNGKGAITVVNKDYSGTPVTITVSQAQSQIGVQSGVKGSAAGVTLTFPVAWQPNTEYTVHVVRDDKGSVVGDVNVTTPATACETAATTAPATTPPATTAPAGTTAATTAPATTPSPSTTTAAAAAVADTNEPSPAAGGTSNLAETGGSGNTGMIAGIAAVLVALGGVAVFALRRRNPAARH
ncbi:LAETG motif-containing sortase-dependent surface protein [Streptomyces sp.]|uniref:LAETG motif-containing sortase-dependent surface protein n=1 Tax=Streptomyces sp. TaxID=1931 RepID=UPI002F40247F